jgi:hypothetical protein
VKTDRTIANYKPDIIICDNEKATCMLIRIAILRDRNVIQEGSRNYFKTQKSKNRSRAMWNVITKVIPVITGATGTTSKSSRKCL